MRQRLAIALAALFVVSQLLAQTSRTADVQFKAAQHKEQVEGDLKGAIEEYKRLAEGRDRAIAAKALIQMAECYQKLGDAESQKVYQRIVQEFADQKDALALARARLGGSAVANVKGDRVVWTVPKAIDDAYQNDVSRDGRFITWVNGDNGSLMLHDVAANTDRVLTPTAPNIEQYAGSSAISNDGEQVVYVLEDHKKKSQGFNIAGLQGSGFLAPRQFFLANDDVQYFGSMDWSPDGKWIAAAMYRKDRTGGIVLITVANGSLKVLKSISDRNNMPESIFFSPDSTTIAYDGPATDTSPQRDVFVLDIDSSREMPSVVHGAKAVIGWAPDGRRLLFSSDRTGAVGLWAIRFADGKAQGAPELLKPDIGPGVSLGLTASGTLYMSKSINSRDTMIAPIDLDAGKLLGPPVNLPQGFVNGAQGPGLWSPDGNYLAYSAPCHDRQCVAIRSVDTGKVSLLTGIDRVFGPRWSPDGRSLLTRGVDEKKRNGWFQFDVRTGDVTALTVFTNGERGEQVHWSPDGKVKVYFNRSGVFIERDVASGVEREINRVPGLVGVGPLSPDGQYFAPNIVDPSTKTATLLIVPVAGGKPRELLRLAQPEVIGGCCAWTPDSSAVLFVKETGSRRELWLIPIAAGQPRKLDIDPNLWMEGGADQGFDLSPDGRRIAFQMGKTVNEVWALENFLPASTRNK